jgi:malate permease and related proteins
LAVLSVLFPIFFLVLVGFVFSRTLRSAIEPLTQFSLFVGTPAIVMYALLQNPVPAAELGRLLLMTLSYTGILWAISEAVGRLLGLDEKLRRAFALAVVPMNVGNYGIPLSRLAFGPAADSYSVLVFVIFNIPLATWAIWIAAGGGASPWKGLKETLRIPIVWATVIAFGLAVLRVQLPGPLMKSLGMLGEAVIPLLMVILGMQLQRTIVLRDATGSLVTATLLRLVLSPFLAWGLTVVLGFTGLEQKVVILQTSTPAAVLPLLYALRFDCRPDWIAANLLVSTLASGVTLAILLNILL